MSNLLARAADATACAMLNDIGGAGTRMAVWTMWAPKAALVPLTVGALGYMANNLLCQETAGPPGPGDPELKGCVKGQPGKGYVIRHRSKAGEVRSCMQPVAGEIVGLGQMREFNGYWGRQVEFIHWENGNTMFYNACVARTEEEARDAEYWLGVPEGECVKEEDPDGPGQPNPDLPPYDYTDPETNCNYTLKLEGFVQQYENGPAQPVWNIRSADSGRADGGRMGGCSLSPTIYIGGDGSGDGGPNGPPQFPVPPTIPPDGPDGVPWWLPPLLGATTGALLNQIGRLLNDTFNYNMNPGAFEFIAPCDFTDEGKNESRIYTWQEEPLILRLHTHQVAMMQMLQQHLDWKTPICGNEKPPLEGQWVTTRWLSTEKMDHSGVRLRKLFRYRTKSTRNLGQLSAYWESFTWQAGPVIVWHEGAWWGSPKVWAASQEEGQRVIRFAAAEAGLDPDQDGQWGTSSSRSPRYGMSGTMTIHLKDGFPWVSARESDSWPNTLARAHDSESRTLFTI